MITERLPNVRDWWRIAEAGWVEPLDPAFAAKSGGRWNPPESFATLYLNEDLVTARLNLRRFIQGWPYEPEDLRSETGPMLVCARLPRKQRVCDVHTPAGVAAVGLPPTYPRDAQGYRVPHPPCQLIGTAVKKAGLRGVRARSAREPEGSGRELAWFPATAASRARRVTQLAYDDWFWA